MIKFTFSINILSIISFPLNSFIPFFISSKSFLFFSTKPVNFSTNFFNDFNASSYSLLYLSIVAKNCTPAPFSSIVKLLKKFEILFSHLKFSHTDVISLTISSFNFNIILASLISYGSL